MKNKLQTFTHFAHNLLPHETEYLLSVQQFQDNQKVEILRQIDFNGKNRALFKPFDEEIDKRKYSSLKSWIEEHLTKIDVDTQYEWITLMHKRIMTDSITSEEEKDLLKSIREYPLPDSSGAKCLLSFYFMQFYELVQDYRQYLLIRMRYNEHLQTDIFYKNYKEQYVYCRSVNDKMHDVTLDIVQQYSKGESESIVWEEWLTERFYDSQLDGLNAYYALVRLTFIYNNYRKFEKLRDKYDYIDAKFKLGAFYSKRLLVNYYGNRLLLHTRFKEYDKAEYYGYLSIRVKNSDYVHYVNNLCAILLRGGKNEAALKLMREAHPETKNMQSFHNRVGFVSFYIKSLNVNGLCRNAESYGESFLRVYQKEIFEHRWHLFFTAYMESLLGLRKYPKLLQTVRRLKLLEKEKNYCKDNSYLPSILLYQTLAAYKEDKIHFDTLKTTLKEQITKFQEQPDRKRHVENIVHIINEHLSEWEKSIRLS